MTGTYWSREELDTLITMYPCSTFDEILKKLPGRNYSAIMSKAHFLNLKKIKNTDRWTPAEEKFLIDNYARMTAKQLARELNNRPPRHIYHKAKELGIKKNNRKLVDM